MKNESVLREAFRMVLAEEAMLEATGTAVLREMRKRRRGLGPVVRMAAAAACMLVLFFAGYGTRAFLEPVSVISIDINPSLELGVNRLDRVVSVEGFNPEGQALAENLNLRFLTSTQAVERIVSSETVTGLLSREEELYITVVGENEQTSAALCRQLESCIEDARSQCHAVPLENVEEAHHCGLSYGKYLAFLEAQAENTSLTPEDVRGMTMHQLRQLSGQKHDHGHTPPETAPPREETQAAEETVLPTEDTWVPQDTHGKHNQFGHKRKNHH